MVLEVGWQDCQSSPTRTLYPRFCYSSSHADLLLSTTVLKAHALPISRPSCCLFIHGQKRSCFSSRRTSIVCSFLTGSDCFPRTGFSWFLSTYFSSANLQMVWLYSSLTNLFVGPALSFSFTPRLGNYNLFPSMVYVCFPGDFIAKDELSFPHVVSHVH